MSGGTTGTPGLRATPAEIIAQALPSAQEAPLPLQYAVRADLDAQWASLSPISPQVIMRILRLEAAALALAYPAWARQVAPRASLAGARYDLMTLGDTILEAWLARLPPEIDPTEATSHLTILAVPVIRDAVRSMVTKQEVEAQVNFTGPGGGG